MTQIPKPKDVPKMVQYCAKFQACAKKCCRAKMPSKIMEVNVSSLKKKTL